VSTPEFTLQNMVALENRIAELESELLCARQDAEAQSAEASRLRAQVVEMQRVRVVDQRKLQSAVLTLNASISDAGSTRKQMLTLIDGTNEQLELQAIRERRRAAKATDTTRAHCAEHAGWRSDCSDCAESETK
jgi:hypothetical protein